MLGEGSAKFLIGTVVGAVGGFAVGSFVATPTAKSFGNSALGGAGASVRFLGRQTVKTARVLGNALELSYTRLRGRQAYLEQEIEELREQITRLEQRTD